MKRDWDLIRQMLIKVEQDVGGYDVFKFDGGDIPDTDTRVVHGHFKMLRDAGFFLLASNSNEHITGLSWSGHEFLDTIRDDEIWKKTKSGVNEMGNVGIDILFGIAKEYAKQKASSTWH